MYWKRKNKEAREFLSKALEDEGFDVVKSLAKQLGLTPKSRKKLDAVAEILPLMQDESSLRKIWDSLDEMQKKAVSEAIYHKTFEFDEGRFKTKYGQNANFGKKVNYDYTPSFLRLFIFSDEVGSFVPKDLAVYLKKFATKPKGFVVKTVAELPEKVTIGIPSYRQTTLKEFPLTVAETTNNAMQEIFPVVRLIDEKKISFSDKTSIPSSASLRAINEVLPNGDFYELKEDKSKYPQIGEIKSFAWAMLFQASKIAQFSAKKFIISNDGRKILSKPAHEIIKSLWETWRKNTILDEFNRVDEIKGQKYKGKSNLTGIKPRRESVVKALELCPIGEWIAIDEFFRCVRLNFDFEIVRDEWNLYICSKDYGALGYEYSNALDKWQVLQARYILAVLFEYVATLGLIDVAYTSPFQAKNDYNELWGTDDLDFLSRYDGLQFIRINELGAYCLGLAKDFTPPKIAVKSFLSILPNLKVKVLGEPLTIEEELFFKNFAVKEDENAWQISRELTIQAIENGQDIEQLRDFLEKREEQDLPETVEGFLRDAPKRANALKNKGLAQIIECQTKEIADEIASNPNTKKLCLRVGEKSLAVWESSEKQFREIVRKIGYGVKFE
jgi:hypothetical protein